MNKNNIPSEEEFARAMAAMRRDDRGLSDVSDRILKRFHGRGVHECFLFYSPPTNTFGAYVFYLSDQELAEREESGLSTEIRESVYDELTAVGRGDRASLDVIFEFDSHENVERNYGGDYFNRLR